MKYLVIVPVEAYPIDHRRFAVESAFCDHLQQLLADLGPPFTNVSVAAVRMREQDYEANRGHLGVLDAERDGIRLETLCEAEDDQLGFARRVPSMLRRLSHLIRTHDLVHAGISHDITRPVELAGLMMAAREGKPTISVTDIDLRDDARMNHQLGRWSLKSYLLCKYIYDPIRHLQQEAIVRRCSLVLFKDETLREDYGRGRPHVRVMRDPNFRAHHLISERALEAKIAMLLDRSQPLDVVSFGRLTYYKGVDRCIEAIARVRAMGEDVRLTIMGAGEEEARLRELVRERALEDRVTFRPPIRYGDPFFEALRPHHLTLLTPLSNDTPRSTWDALASAVPVVAFDTPFNRGLAQVTRGVETVPWPSVEALAARVAHHARFREGLVGPMRDALRVARENTGERWLRLRNEWTRELVGERPPRAAPSLRRVG